MLNNSSIIIWFVKPSSAFIHFICFINTIKCTARHWNSFEIYFVVCYICVLHIAAIYHFPTSSCILNSYFQYARLFVQRLSFNLLPFVVRLTTIIWNNTLGQQFYHPKCMTDAIQTLTFSREIKHLLKIYFNMQLFSSKTRGEGFVYFIF